MTLPEFPFKKFLKSFSNKDIPGDDPERAHKAAWRYAEESAASLRRTGLVDFFGIVVRKAKSAKATWEVWIESWNGKK